jgi:nitrogen fixation/metabolism regulation signal transduction histidine kinase
MTTSAAVDRSGTQRRLRNYLLDSRFQFKYAGLLVLVALGVAVVMGMALYSTTTAVLAESARVLEESQNVLAESQQVSDISRMNVRELAADSPELIGEFRRQVDENDRAMGDRQKALAANQAALVRRQAWMMASLVGGLALMVAAVSLYGIYFTHRVAGPIFKVRKLLNQLERGEYPVGASLRKGDEFHEFFGDFMRLAAALREREARHASAVDAVRTQLEHGTGADVQLALDRLRAEFKRGESP